MYTAYTIMDNFRRMVYNYLSKAMYKGAIRNVKRKNIKAVLFIIVFLLVIAVAVNLLVDMQSERKAEATPTNDPYANAGWRER